VKEWLCYQALWDLQADNLYGRLGTDINLWMKCLSDIKTSRATFDTTDTRKEFGPIVIDYAKVQSKVSLKYDSWHKETLSKFGSLLGNEMSEFHSQVSKVTMNLYVKYSDKHYFFLCKKNGGFRIFHNLLV
jgi:dynein heavy chain 1, cytosolic